MESRRVKPNSPLAGFCPAQLKRLASVVVLILLAALLSGCVSLRDPETSFDYTGDIIATIEANNSVGLSWQSRRPKLENIQLYLRKASDQAADTDVMMATLYHRAQDSQPIIAIPISYRELAHAFPVTIAFPAQNDPPGQGYYMTLSTTGGALALYGRGEDANPQSSLYLNGQPVIADAAMRTSYRYDLPAMLGDLAACLPILWLVLPLFLLLWAPGQLALELVEAISRSDRLSKPSSALAERQSFLASWDWSERQALALGLSLAIIPLLMLWTSTLGLQWSRTAVYIGAALSLLGLAALTFRRWRRFGRLSGPKLNDLALLALIGLALAMRLIMVRDLATPAWVDPIHHSVIVRLIVEQGAYPDSYAPYIDTLHASYHAGFHSIVATFHWLSGLEIPEAMLILCQVLNALSLLAAYLLATSFTKNHLAGLLAALATGFLSSMPAYYASWGRYTQLAGLLVLPVCTALLMRLLAGRAFPADPADKNPTRLAEGDPTPITTPAVHLQMSLQLVILGWLACAGLFMIHYRVAGFWGLLLFAWCLGELIRSLDKQPLWKTIPAMGGWLAAVGVPAIVISLPWWPAFMSSLILPGLSSSPAPQPLQVDWGLLTPVYGKQVMILAAAGFLICLLRARWFGPVLALWLGLLFLSANQGIIPLPGASFINLTSVEIMFFLPLTTLAGYFASFVIQGIGEFIPARLWRTLYAGLLAGGGLVVVLAGARLMLPILNPVTILTRQADLPAMRWIADNIAADETILINPFLWGYGNIYAGQDGGYWITPLAGRKTMPPPILYTYGNPTEVKRVNETSQRVIEQANNPQAVSEVMKEQRLRYIYLGRRGGVLSARRLIESGLFQTLYTQDGVWVFELKNP